MLKAIRGATTINADTAEEIRSATAELLHNIIKKNSITERNMVCITFTSTSDIHSYYPAKAAREAGFCSCALFSALEPPIDGSLKLCIRAMALVEVSEERANEENFPVHVYLNGAAALRRDLVNKYNIALDGPAGSGKSTVARIVSQKLNILYLDTGAMYRACAVACDGLDFEKDGDKIAKAVEGADIQVRYMNGEQRTYLNGADVSFRIREPRIAMFASKVSALPYVREKIVPLQQKIAARTSCILDGRDIGTNVLPNAEFKFFLSATPEIRAQRRAEENKQKGYDGNYKDILAEIIKRDEQDRTRAIAPLVQADDAVLIDTSDITAEEVANTIIKIVQEKI